MPATIGLVWAQARDRVVGRDNAIPWRIPEDTAHFKQLTTGATVIMGRRTWESLPPSFRPLPDRANIVLTRSPSFVAAGADVVASLDEALRRSGDVWVMGGTAVWTAALPVAERAVITDVDISVGGDVYAPELGPEWIITQDEGWQQSGSGLRYRIRHLRRG